MRELQTAIITEMGVKPEIDPAEEVERRVRFLADYLLSAHGRSLVLGISGGVDSTLAGALAQRAAERLRDAGHEVRFHAVRLPHGVQHDEDDAARAVEFIGADHVHTVNIEQAVTGLDAAYAETMGRPMEDYHRGNVKARLRMTAQYAIAGEHGGLVVGTDHAAESITGFFTKHGDGGADVLPLFTLNKRQVRQILKHLGADEALWSKAPTADLLDENPGQLDETELGMSYDDIDDYLEGREVSTDFAEIIERRYLATRHKRALPVTIQDTWWRS
ncbi:ammonia-dependent NAD(+) synthetase [Nesterenkonia sp. CL21]|uniref:ammonia-dependent NAD(+) synthetase n=1 Tax=Nesterenkonia sp. CL21 TaxID=3064894 RepID=UPI002878FB66|nr:ammonia-dependent NAD(+) synthetase [Nesterenkonia sp. CL21]MDS2174281.1 ammonia-dependent NAD(+) synthetase [Nesterenkonia sp. CL21]